MRWGEVCVKGGGGGEGGGCCKACRTCRSEGI